MKLNQKASLYFVILMALSISGCATLQEIFDIHSGAVRVETDDGYIKVVFSERDRRAIRRHYGKKRKYKRLPPGLAKKDTLPPGLQKRLDAGESLPPGLQGRDLPDELEDILSPIPKGYIRLKVGGNVVIMNKDTEVVVDIIRDI